MQVRDNCDIENGGLYDLTLKMVVTYSQPAGMFKYISDSKEFICEC